MQEQGKDTSTGLIALLSGVAVLAGGLRTIFLFLLLGLVAGVGAIFLPAKYTAEAIIMPPQASSSLGGLVNQVEGLSAMAGAGASSSLASLRSTQDLYVALVQSNTVQADFADRFRLADEYHTRGMTRTLRALRQHLEVDGTGKDGLIRIRITDKDPKRAADLTNGYIQQFQQFSRSLAFGEASKRRSFFEKQLADEKEKLTESEENLRKTEQASGAVELGAQTQALIQSAAALRAQVAAKQVEVDSIRSYAGNGNVQLIQAEGELAALRGQLQKISGTNADSSAGLLLPKSQLPQTELDFIRDTRDVKYHETLFAILSRQLEDARLDEAKQGTSVQIIDNARIPDLPSSPASYIKVLFGTVVGLFLGCMIVITRHVFAKLRAEQGVEAKIQSIRAAMQKS